MSDLRTLAQAVVDARKALWDGPCTVCEERGDNLEALRLAENALAALGAENDWVNGHEAAILAALDAADAQGYARALGQIESLCADDQWALALHTAGDALAAVANWARERLPAAAEKEHGG